ncbi:hypothetical protein [Vibrio phage BUCT233]|uniref:Uncharacterized protein n=1 Tax=Vibrio phage BUCT233 TaxID=2834267 RepID=A0A8E8PCN5_9CAUD|nr:hypothetical protein [Vibrio phage BUCT233]QYW05879.1 hypothetical protein [Vibrio phage vB_VpP_NS8]
MKRLDSFKREDWFGLLRTIADFILRRKNK